MDEEKNENSKKKKKPKSKYDYKFGDKHPGIKCGHKYCSELAHRASYPVPPNMGWLWNAHDVPGIKPRKGWTPGVIGKSVMQNMTLKCPRASGPDKKKKKKKKPGALVGGGDSDEEPLVPKPTLKIQRKGNVFTITVHPLKDLTDIRPNEDPYVECDPLIFKIIKKRSPEELAKMEARKMVKIKRDRDAAIRKALAEAVEDICKCAYMDVYCNDLTAIDGVINNCPAFQEPECLCKEESMSSLSSGATWDIEYTPPFGCFDLAPRKRVHYIHTETQYSYVDAGIPEPKCCKRPCCRAAKKTSTTNANKKCTGNCKKPFY